MKAYSFFRLVALIFVLSMGLGFKDVAHQNGLWGNVAYLSITILALAFGVGMFEREKRRES